jgi:DNA-binding MarR family transcriptional regulator
MSATTTQHANATAADVRTQHEVYRLLRNRGPQCASQIAAVLLVSLRRVTRAISALEQQGLVERRPDHRGSQDPNNPEIPWGLPRFTSLLRKVFSGR